jgi:hypothetical protein
MDIIELADRIYSEVYGDTDSKAHRSERTGEIEDWLAEGDAVDTYTLPERVERWREYVADEAADGA